MVLFALTPEASNMQVSHTKITCGLHSDFQLGVGGLGCGFEGKMRRRFRLRVLHTLVADSIDQVRCRFSAAHIRNGVNFGMRDGKKHVAASGRSRRLYEWGELSWIRNVGAFH